MYEYFLSRFASAEGKKGGQFYTPSRVVRVLVEMLAPYKGRVYDPYSGNLLKLYRIRHRRRRPARMERDVLPASEEIKEGIDGPHCIRIVYVYG